MEWTTEQILALAPDDSSAKAARGLLVPAKWPLLAHSDVAVWGECQGSGARPYQVQIDLGGPAFKCSCPSRKFPCKHGLALLLLRMQKPANFRSGEPPPWVTEWLASRQDRAEKQAEKKAAPTADPAAASSSAAAPADPAAAARREARRRERMAGGVADFERWLHDQIRHGLGQLPTKPAAFWDELTARQVDAQVPGWAFSCARWRLRQPVAAAAGPSACWPPWAARNCSPTPSPGSTRCPPRPRPMCAPPWAGQRTRKKCWPMPRKFPTRGWCKARAARKTDGSGNAACGCAAPAPDAPLPATARRAQPGPAVVR